MKLVYSEIETQIVFSENLVNVLVLEKLELFVKFICDLTQKIDQGMTNESFILSKESEILPLSKNLDLIVDVFNLSANTKKVLNALYADLAQMSQNEDFYLQTSQVCSQMTKLVDDLIFSHELGLVYDEEISMMDLFKAAKVQIDDTGNSLLERIINYFVAVNDVLGIAVFVFVNLKTFLTPSELELLYREAFLRKIHLLLLESRVDQRKSEVEKVIIIDSEGCEIY